MSKNKKLFLGAATFWPFLYIFIFMFAMFGMMATMGPGSEGPPLAFFAIIIMHFITIFGVFGLMIYYIVHALKNEQLEGDRKILWAAVIFFGNMIAMPVYWYLKIWKAPELDSTPGEPISPGSKPGNASF